MKHILAAVAAIAMVAGSIVIRNWIDDGGELSLGGVESTIYCEAAIEDACREAFDSATIVVEAPGVTLDRLLAQGDETPIVWVAADLWFDIAVAERDRTGFGAQITDRSDPVAHSPLVLGGLEGTCDGPSWACAARIDGTLGTGDLNTSSGLATQVQLAATVLGGVGFASNDPGFSTWESQISLDIAPERSELFLLGRYLNSPGFVDVISVTQASVVSLGREIDVAVPDDPGPPLRVGVAAIGGARLPGAIDDLADALVDQGWQSGLGPDADRPSGGAMAALRS